MEEPGRKNIWIFIKAIIIVTGIIGIKFIAHALGLEFLTINNLFSGIIAANVFLMGFLLNGVLSDYKESEKIPGEIASSINNIFSELIYLYDDKKILKSKECMLYCQELTKSILDWFYRKERTTSLIAKTRYLNSLYARIENDTQANYIVRIKNEMANLSKSIIRVDTIRDTNFIASGYQISISVTALMCIGLIFSKIDPFYESLFFVGVITFLMVFLILLIHDLDDPFGYSKKYSAENVSLYPIKRILTEMELLNKERNIT
jgi:predicted membrane chloride channel (bestrophin family)